MAIPLWLIGRTVTAVAVTPLVADSSGVLSAASMGLQSFLAVVDEVSYQGQVTTQEISALTASRRNAVPLEQDDTVVVTEISRSAAGSIIAAAIWTASDTPDWGLFTFSRGANTITLYGMLSRFEQDVQKGKSVARLTLRLVDNNVFPALS